MAPQAQHGDSDPMPPPSKSVNHTGQWPAAAPGSPQDVARAAYSSERHVRALEAEVGHAPVPAKQDGGSGLWKALVDGFAEMRAELEAQNKAALEYGKKIDTLVEAAALANATRSARGKTAGDLALSTLKGALLALCGFLGHFAYSHFHW